ncbi:hypothetical protein Tco_0134975 [Tanacetum coccineum]
MKVEFPNFEAKKRDKNKRYKSSGSNSLNTTHLGEGSFNFNMQAGDDEEEDVWEVQRPMGGTTQRKNERHHRHLQNLTMRKSETKATRFEIREMKQRHQDEIFYLQHTNHLTGLLLDQALEMKRVIKEK